MTGAGAPEIHDLPLDSLRKGWPVARHLDTEFGWQRDDLASALRYQEEISIPDLATAI